MSTRRATPIGYWSAVGGMLALAALTATADYSYLLFHSLAELLSIVVACGVFMVAWNSRGFVQNGYLLLLGIASLFIAGIDLIHALAYKGMGVFVGYDADLPTQLWIAARSLHALSLLAAIFWVGRKLRPAPVVAAYLAATTLLLLSIFTWHVFPACFVEGSGLTLFKRSAEYVISALLLVAAAMLAGRRAAFDPDVFRLLVVMLAATIGSELAFTFYVDVYGLSNKVGHLLKVVAFAALYLAVVESSFRRPYSTLFRDLKQSEEALRASGEELRVAHAEQVKARGEAEANAARAEAYAERLEILNEELEAANAELQTQAEELEVANTELLAQASELARQKAGMEALSRALAVERARLEAVVRQMPAGVIIAAAPSGEILIGNAELERIFGRPALPLSSVRDFGTWARERPDGSPYQPDEIPIARTLRAGEVVVGEEIHVRRADGTRRVVSASAAPIRDGRGQVVAVVSVNLDITERKRAEDVLHLLADAGAALAASLDYEETLGQVARLALPLLADCCVIDVVDGDGAVRRVAAAHTDPTRQPLADVLRRYPPAAGGAAGVSEVIQSGRPVLRPDVGADEIEAVALDDEHRHALRVLAPRSALIVPLVARGRTLGAITFALSRPGRRYRSEDLPLAEEIARRAALAVDNARLYQEAREANAAKDQFLAVLSHELRNPLSPILAGVELLRRALPDDGRIGRTLGAIERNAKLQARLVNDLLDLSRVTRGKIQLQRAPVALDAVVRAAFQDQQARVEGDGPSLTVEAEPGLWVLGDFDRLQQVVLNILSNAVKFTPEGGRIRVGAWECGNVGDDGRPAPPVARVVVEDTGIGIDRSLLEHLFEMFRQGEVGSAGQRGLGIGLALVRSLVEMHGGRVWAESEGPGKGSRFTVELPLIAAPAASEAAPALPERRDRPVEVLLVEDNPDTRAMVAGSLRLMGYHVETAGSAEEALRSLGGADASPDPDPPSWRPEVILSDIGLPGANGYEFLRRARAVAGLERVPAFAITGYGQQEDVRRAREAGFAGHFVKPVDVGALDRRIREWLAGAAGDTAR